MQTQKEMDTALDYVGLAATTGLSAYILAQLLSGGSANRQLYHSGHRWYSSDIWVDQVLETWQFVYFF